MACAAGSLAFQNRGRRPPHVPVREVVDEAAEAGGGGEGVEALQRVGDRGDGVVELGEDPAVEHVGGSAVGPRRARRLPAVEVGVGGEEGEHVPEREQRLAGRLPDALVGHPAGGPRLSRPRRSTSAARRRRGGRRSRHGSMTLPRGLRHLLAVGVDDEAEAHHVAVGRRVEHQRVDGEQRVEPAARLVDGLADEVGRERRVEGLGARRRGSGAGPTASSPSRTRRRARARSRRASAPQPRAGTGSVTSSTYGRWRSRSARSRPARSASSATDPMHVSCPLGAAPDRAAACPSSGRARAPSRRCPPATCRTGRA